MFRDERESPRARARDYYATPPKLRSQLLSQDSATGRALLRIHKKLLGTIAESLENAGAPFYVWRWVAFGDGLSNQQVRYDLVMHLRQERAVTDPHLWAGEWKWPNDLARSVALRVYEELRSGSRTQRRNPPKPADIPAEVYRSHIEKARDEVTRKRRAVGQQHSSEPVLSGSEIKTLEGILEKHRRAARRFA